MKRLGLLVQFKHADMFIDIKKSTVCFIASGMAPVLLHKIIRALQGHKLLVHPPASACSPSCWALLSTNTLLLHCHWGRRKRIAATLTLNTPRLYPHNVLIMLQVGGHNRSTQEGL